MQVAGSAALVSGADLGIGRAVAEEVLADGAGKVYASAGRPELVDVADVGCCGSSLTRTCGGTWSLVRAFPVLRETAAARSGTCCRR